MRLKDAVDICTESRDSWKNGKGAATAQINIRHVLRILGPDFDIQSTTSDTFKKITDQLLSEGKAGSTVNRITTVLSTILNELRKLGYDTPRVDFKRMKEPRGRVEYFYEEDVDRLLRAAAEEPDYLLLHDSILFAIKTGCRQGGMLSLVSSDVDMDKQTILFRDTKNGDDHWIKMHEDLVPVMERRLNARIGSEVFAWSGKDALLRAFRRAKANAGLPDDSRVWHTLRHSVATWLVERDVPLRTVMGVLTHKRVETTLRYAKASDRAVNAAIDLL